MWGSPGRGFDTAPGPPWTSALRRARRPFDQGYPPAPARTIALVAPPVREDAKGRPPPWGSGRPSDGSRTGYGRVGGLEEADVVDVGVGPVVVETVVEPAVGLGFLGVAGVELGLLVQWRLLEAGVGPEGAVVPREGLVEVRVVRLRPPRGRHAFAEVDGVVVDVVGAGERHLAALGLDLRQRRLGRLLGERVEVGPEHVVVVPLGGVVGRVAVDATVLV